MAKSAHDSVTIRDVYELVDAAKQSFEKAIDKLSDRFDTLESGRLSVIETKVANMEGRLMMIPLLISISINVFFFIIQYIIKPK